VKIQFAILRGPFNRFGYILWFAPTLRHFAFALGYVFLVGMGIRVGYTFDRKQDTIRSKPDEMTSLF